MEVQREREMCKEVDVERGGGSTKVVDDGHEGLAILVLKVADLEGDDIGGDIVDLNVTRLRRLVRQDL